MATRRLRAVLEAKDNATATIGRVKQALGVLGAVAATVGAVQIGRKLVAGLEEAIELAGVQERADIKLAQSLRQVGRNAQEQLPALKAMAAEFQSLTGYGDEAIQMGQSLLVTMADLKGRGLEDATQAALNLAAATDRDLNTAFNIVAKAATGFTGELSRYGILLDESIPKSEKAAAAIAKINEVFGGQAQARLKTYQGALEALGNATGDLQEVLGAPFRDVIRTVTTTTLLPLTRAVTDAASATSSYELVVLQTARTGLIFAQSMVSVARSVSAIIPVGTVAAGVLGLMAQKMAELERDARLIASIPQAFAGLMAAISPAQIPSPFAAIAAGAEDAAEKTDAAQRTILGTLEQGLGESIAEIDAMLAGLTERTGEHLERAAEIARAKLEALRAEIAKTREATVDWQANVDQIVAEVAEDQEHFRVSQPFAEENYPVEGLENARDMTYEIGEAGEDMFDYWINGIKDTGHAFQNDIGRVGFNAVRNLTGTLIQGALGADIAWRTFWRNFMLQTAAAIAQAVILRAILEGTKLGRFLSFGGGGGAQGMVVPSARAQHGALLRGPDTGRDKLLVAARPNEAILPPELTRFLLEAAHRGTGGGEMIEIRLTSDLPLLAEELNASVRRGNVRIVASELATAGRAIQ